MALVGFEPTYLLHCKGQRVDLEKSGLAGCATMGNRTDFIESRCPTVRRRFLSAGRRGGSGANATHTHIKSGSNLEIEINDSQQPMSILEPCHLPLPKFHAYFFAYFPAYFPADRHSKVWAWPDRVMLQSAGPHR